MARISAKVKIEGLAECLEALEELPKRTQKNALKRMLTKVAEPIRADATAMGTYTDRRGTLRRSIEISTKLNKEQASDVTKSKFRQEVYVGPKVKGSGKAPHGHLVEYGTVKTRPYPFMRPAWEKNKHAALAGMKDQLWQEIEKAVARIAKKAAREAAKMK